MISRLFLTVSLLASPAMAASINISIQGSLLQPITSSISNPSGNSEISNSQSVGAISIVTHYAMSESFVAASPGILRTGVAAFAGDPDPTSFVFQSLSGSFSAGGGDMIFINGGPSSGFISLDVKLEGGTQLNSTNDAGPGQPQTADSRWFLDYTVNNRRLLSIRDDAAIGSVNVVHVSTDLALISKAAILIPYTGTSAAVNQSIVGSYRCDAGRLESCAATGFFENTFQLGGAVVLDASGNPVSGATVTSQTGYDYSQQLALSAAPEPGGFVLAGLSLFILTSPVCLATSPSRGAPHRTYCA